MTTNPPSTQSNSDDARFGTEIPVREVPLDVMQGKVSFMDFMSKLFEETKDFGACRLRPHPDWNPLGMDPKQFHSFEKRIDAYKSHYTKLQNQMIRHPIQQEPHGSKGFYSFILMEQDDLSLKEFEKKAADNDAKEKAILGARRRRAHRSNPNGSKQGNGTQENPESFSKQEFEEEFERDYWKRILHHRPLYGADLTGSLFNQSVNWNLNDLNTILDIVSSDIKGVTSSYLYFGMHRSTFAWHIEDMNLPAINYLHFGAGKQWYVIPEWAHTYFEDFCKDRLKDEFKRCDQFLRHKTTLVSPQLLRSSSVPVYSGVQQEGEFMVLWPVAYHCGFNTGFNCAEAVNFAFDPWIPFGDKAKYCMCSRDSVKFDMNWFKHAYDQVMSGEAKLSDFKQIRTITNNGAMNTMKEARSVSRCSKVSEAAQARKTDKNAKNLATNPPKTRTSKKTKKTSKTSTHSKRKKASILENTADSMEDEPYEDEEDAPFVPPDEEIMPADKEAEKAAKEAAGRNKKKKSKSKKRKRSTKDDATARKKRREPRGEALCSIEDCTRMGNRSVTSLRNKYKMKPDATGKVCDRHYFSDRRHFMRGTDPNQPPPPKKPKKSRTSKKPKKTAQQSVRDNVQDSKHDTLHITQGSDNYSSVPVDLLLQDDDSDLSNKVSYSELSKSAPMNMTMPIMCKDDMWNAIASGADPTQYFPIQSNGSKKTQ